MPDLLKDFRDAKKREAKRRPKRGKTSGTANRKIIGRAPSGVQWVCYREPGDTAETYRARCATMRAALRELKAKKASKKAKPRKKPARTTKKASKRRTKKRSGPKVKTKSFGERMAALRRKKAKARK